MAFIVPIAAGVGSFLLAKASGASNRDALIAGGIGALGGAAALKFGTAAGAGSLATALGGTTTKAALTGITAGTLGAAAMQGQPGQAQPLEQMNVGFKGVDPAQYAQAR